VYGESAAADGAAAFEALLDADFPLTTPGADGSLLTEWARDALALALPSQIVCREDCAGLCPICGEDLNANPHEHEREPDPRWGKLSELKFE